MITFSVALKITAVFPQNFTDYFFILCHYAYTAARRSAFIDREAFDGSCPISSSNSGAACRARSTSTSREPDSRIRPGMSSLVQYQTWASSSQTSLILYSLIMPLPSPSLPAKWHSYGSDSLSRHFAAIQ